MPAVQRVLSVCVMERSMSRWPSPKLDLPRRTREVQARRTPQALQPRHLYVGRNTSQLEFLNSELPRFEARGAWER
jgi:hypothetical protein